MEGNEQSKGMWRHKESLFLDCRETLSILISLAKPTFQALRQHQMLLEDLVRWIRTPRSCQMTKRRLLKDRAQVPSKPSVTEKRTEISWNQIEGGGQSKSCYLLHVAQAQPSIVYFRSYLFGQNLFFHQGNVQMRFSFRCSSMLILSANCGYAHRHASISPARP